MAAVGLTVALAACGGSSGSSTESSSSEANSTASQSTATPVAASEYSGPESAITATSYPEPTKQSGKSLTFGLIVPNAANPALQLIERGAEAEAKKLGAKLIALDDQFSPQREVSNFSQLLSQHVNGIIDFPLLEKALGQSSAQAKEQKVPVIALDTPTNAEQSPLPDVSSTILFGRDHGAYELTKTVANAFPGASFATLGVGLPVAGLTYETEREQYWGKKAGLKFLGNQNDTTDSAAAAAQAAQGLLGRYSSLEVIFAYTDEAATAAAAEARAQGRTNVKVVGFTGDPEGIAAIKSGQLWGTYQMPYRKIGAAGVDGLYDIADGETLPTRILMAGRVVTKSNVAEAEE